MNIVEHLGHLLGIYSRGGIAGFSGWSISNSLRNSQIDF